MKDGVIILNNSRGVLIVEEDLREALESKKVYAAGVDVVSEEPIREDNPLLKAPNCLITPHISWASRESRQRLMSQEAENVRHLLPVNPFMLLTDRRLDYGEIATCRVIEAETLEYAYDI